MSDAASITGGMCVLSSFCFSTAVLPVFGPFGYVFQFSLLSRKHGAKHATHCRRWCGAFPAEEFVARAARENGLIRAFDCNGTGETLQSIRWVRGVSGAFLFPRRDPGRFRHVPKRCSECP